MDWSVMVERGLIVSRRFRTGQWHSSTNESREHKIVKKNKNKKKNRVDEQVQMLSGRRAREREAVPLAAVPSFAAAGRVLKPSVRAGF